MIKSDIDNVVNVVNQSTSRYSLQRTTIKEYEGARMYEYPYQPEVPRSLDDKYIYVTENVRLDQLAHSEYGDSKLWWIIAKVNSIFNPLDELKYGTVLRIPTLTSLISHQVIS